MILDPLLRYTFIASNPYRSDEEDAEAWSLYWSMLCTEDDPGWAPVYRECEERSVSRPRSDAWVSTTGKEE